MSGDRLAIHFDGVRRPNADDVPIVGHLADVFRGCTVVVARHMLLGIVAWQLLPEVVGISGLRELTLPHGQLRGETWVKSTAGRPAWEVRTPGIPGLRCRPPRPAELLVT